MSDVNGLRCQCFSTTGGLGRQRLRVLVHRPLGWEGGGGSRILAVR